MCDQESPLRMLGEILLLSCEQQNLTNDDSYGALDLSNALQEGC